MRPRYTEKEHSFWRSLVLPQEEPRRLTQWHGKGYRWFRSPNVVPIEQWRRNPAGHPQHSIPAGKVGRRG
jgi:hypothetical protein